MPIKDITIVGAGPSGLLLALLLLRNPNNPSTPPPRITIIEALDLRGDTRPRAAYYGPSAVPEMMRAGLMDEIKRRGYVPRWMTWKKLWSAERAAAFKGTDRKAEGGAELYGMLDLDCGWDRQACLPLDALSRLIREEVEAEVARGRGECEIRWREKVVAIGEEGERAWVDAEAADEEDTQGQGGDKTRKRYYSDYVVGCDGASSTVRRLMFGENNFPGMTWDKQIIATNVHYDFSRWGYHDIQFFIHPEHWHMVARLSAGEYWRVSYGERSGLSHDELLERLPAKFAAMFPGHPSPSEYKVTGFSPYKVHQRLAPAMRRGRFLLAADAGHVCNPFGGLGLTGGIVDVGGLYDCLAGIHEGLADDAILDKYSDVRRQKYIEVTDPVSRENIRRLFDQDPEQAGEKDEFIKLIRRAATDEKTREELNDFMRAIKYDFTQHYNKRSSSRSGASAEKL
ncbi:FAD binding domain-containing protein [Phyllosticta citriasiana]|uniref:FAD binding domain-containing protein n=1 Tax=Phyllosticta citriasiana TaxID=595635 RepID=A0ABR1KQV0_9PEZI